MKVATLVSAGVAAVILTGSAAWGQQAHTGVITELNRLNNTVAIRQVQDGTVGANATGPSDTFKIQSGISLDALHAGDRVSYSVSEAGGTKTITKIDRQ
jgi:Copper binding periplasmic protein CusF